MFNDSYLLLLTIIVRAVESWPRNNSLLPGQVCLNPTPLVAGRKKRSSDLDLSPATREARQAVEVGVSFADAQIACQVCGQSTLYFTTTALLYVIYSICYIQVILSGEKVDIFYSNLVSLYNV